MRGKTTNQTVLIILTAIGLQACSAAPETRVDQIMLHEEVLGTIDRFKAEDPGIEERFDSAYGYAVFPTVTKGGAGIGGAHGRGEVIEQEEMVGYCDLSQATIGLQLGGQEYSEVIFFEAEPALSSFKAGKLALAAQASAVATTAGASTDADYEEGVAVFTLASGGLMLEGSVGGQRFRFVPKTAER